MNNISNYNSKYEYHGYQQRYWDDILYYRGKWIHGNEIGYEEAYVVKTVNFYIR
jgi:hypothetical protein